METMARPQSRPTKRHRKPFNLKLWISAWWEILQTSLFFAPLLGVFLSIALGIGLTYLDKDLTDRGIEVPVALSTTVDSARSVLSTIAGATISFAGTAFSLSLLVFQMGSTTYSPRIVSTLFRDPYNRRVMVCLHFKR